MPRYTRTIGLAVTAVVAASSLAACAGKPPTDTGAGDASLPAAIAASKEIRIGLSPDFPPMEYRDEKSQQLAGVDVELAKALGASLGLKVTFVEEKFDQLMNSVSTGRVDIVMSGISDTVQRQETVDFVDYFKSEGRLYTLSARAGEFTSPDQVCGKKLAVSKTTDYYQQALDLDKKECQGAGRPAIQILPTDSGSAARLQLEQKRADLAIQGAENLAFFAKTQPGKFDVVLDPLPANPFAVVLKKGDKPMADLVTKGLTQIQQDGTYDKILKAAGLEYGSMKPVFNGVKE
ncbi:ABC transporter substrate-binding protein [Micromonospora sp. DR5-3]|uniref:ABC transporter substrate-binding protein n=1 Tax=unclassified Micromonospora TaxID=2617518 RepID=UPI0011DB3595|nr:MULTISPECIES: ABC transporter substrate-binding protein [unclassified Micromonospora]MCW3818966.1 ABC transporter substrate-binding protein [Micromonospora sp. DR5-3]TYC19648.1 ABC transporter substrate-binding protein [Micromonospora sp. MP36]